MSAAKNIASNNPWLDLVRSIAIVLVLARHGERALHALTDTSQGFLQTIVMNGWIGVDLFFVLSGYLITRHLYNTGLGTGYFQFGRYLASRALRILPAYYAALLLIVVGAFPFYQFPNEALSIRVAYHLLFLQDYLPSNINVVFWSLGVEEKFYMMAPILVLVLMRCKSAWLLAAVLALALIAPSILRAARYATFNTNIGYEQFWPIFRSPFHMALESLLMGVMIAVAERKGIIRRSTASGLRAFVLGVVLLVGWLGSHDFMAQIGLVDVLFQPAGIAVLGGLIVLGAAQLAETPMPLRTLFGGLSRLSYSLYLMHLPLIPLASLVARDFGALTFWACYLLSSFVAATLLYFAVERPFLQWKRKIDRKSNSPTSPQVVAPLGNPIVNS